MGSCGAVCVKGKCGSFGIVYPYHNQLKCATCCISKHCQHIEEVASLLKCEAEPSPQALETFKKSPEKHNPSCHSKTSIPFELTSHHHAVLKAPLLERFKIAEGDAFLFPSCNDRQCQLCHQVAWGEDVLDCKSFIVMPTKTIPAKGNCV